MTVLCLCINSLLPLQYFFAQKNSLILLDKSETFIDEFPIGVGFPLHLDKRICMNKISFIIMLQIDKAPINIK